MFYKDFVIRALLILFGCLAAFALGSNLTASIVGIFSPFINSSIHINENLLFFLGSVLMRSELFFSPKKLFIILELKFPKLIQYRHWQFWLRK